MDILNPSTAEVIEQVPAGTAEDVDAAVETAKRALPDWLDSTPGELDLSSFTSSSGPSTHLAPAVEIAADEQAAEGGDDLDFITEHLTEAEVFAKYGLAEKAAEHLRAVIERARQMPGREKEVWDYYRNNNNALAQLRAPIYEDKVVDFILELANVTEKKVTREDLYKDDETEKSAA